MDPAGRLDSAVIITPEADKPHGDMERPKCSSGTTSAPCQGALVRGDTRRGSVRPEEERLVALTRHMKSRSVAVMAGWGFME